MKVCAQSIGQLLSLNMPRKSVVRLTDHLYMIIAVDWDIKPQTKQNKNSCHPQISLFVNELRLYIDRTQPLSETQTRIS